MRNPRRTAALLRASARQMRAMADAQDLEADALEEEIEQPTTPAGDELVDGATMGIGPTTWRRACSSGAIVGAALIGRAYKARRSSVEAWIAAQAPTPTTAVKAAPNDLDALLARARGKAA